MSKLKSRKGEKGFTLIELLVVAAIIGILLAIAIPNLIKARISADEVNARKALQTLRDAEGEFFEQDMDNNRIRDYTPTIGTLAGNTSLRCPLGAGDPNLPCTEDDALIDNSFEGAVASGATADCPVSKAGYCVQFAGDVDGTDPLVLQVNFGWEASMISAHKTGRKDFAVYGDKSIRCTASTQPSGSKGVFEADLNSPDCQ